MESPLPFVKAKRCEARPGNLVATHTIVLPDQVEISRPALARGLSDPFKPVAGLPVGMTLGGLELWCGLVNVN
jgi:hypothetical protein